MAVLETTSIGSGPDVVLVHGVGVGPESFAPVAMALASSHRVHVVTRPAPAADAGAPTVADQADDLADTLGARTGGGARVVGTSGGATVVVALGMRHPAAAGSLVAHEPLVGHHAPALHARFVQAAARGGESPEAAVEVVRSIMGEQTWSALGPSGRARVAAAGTRARLEIDAFARFDPTADELATLAGVALLTTVGSRSGPERAEAAEVLRRLAGAEVAVLDGAGNAAQLDVPETLATLVATWQPYAAPAPAEHAR